jgi:hypothetical protein
MKFNVEFFRNEFCDGIVLPRAPSFKFLAGYLFSGRRALMTNPWITHSIPVYCSQRHIDRSSHASDGTEQPLPFSVLKRLVKVLHEIRGCAPSCG